MADTRTALPESIRNPRHPDRICWGCDKYCPADDLACGGGTIRTPHPKELFGDDWRPDDCEITDHPPQRQSPADQVDRAAVRPTSRSG